MNERLRNLVLVFCVFALSNIAFADVQFDDELIGRIDALVSEEMSWNGDTPAYSILIDHGISAKPITTLFTSRIEATPVNSRYLLSCFLVAYNQNPRRPMRRSI